MPHRPYMLLALGVFLFYLAFLPPVSFSIDSQSMMAVAESLWNHGSFAVNPDVGVLGLHGNYYSPWYPLFSVLMVPCVALANGLSRFVHLPAHFAAFPIALVLQAAIVALTTALIRRLAVEFGASPRAALFATLAYALASPLLCHGRTLFAEPLVTLLTGWLLLEAIRDDVPPARAAIPALLLVPAKPITIFALGPVALYLAYRTWLAPHVGLRKLLWVIFGGAGGVALYLVYNGLRFGNPLSFGGHLGGYFTPGNFPVGVARFLLSPRLGPFWYAPTLLLAIPGFALACRARKRAEALLVVAIFAALLFFYALWSAGTWEWGSRYLEPAFPGLFALVALAAPRFRRSFVVLFALGFLINSPNLVYFYERTYVEALGRGFDLGGRDWSLRESPLVQGWPTAIHQMKDAVGMDVTELVRQAGTPHNMSAKEAILKDSRTLRIVGLWWWLLPALRLSRWAGVALALALLGASAWVLRRATGGSASALPRLGAR